MTYIALSDPRRGLFGSAFRRWGWIALLGIYFAIGFSSQRRQGVTTDEPAHLS
jgi:hypothetical protein